MNDYVIVGGDNAQIRQTELGLRDHIAKGLNGRRRYQPRGQTLGGSSSIKAVVCSSVV
ncbi:MAG: hypothetical protein COA60_005150 [Robiginitomaculum sp.]|nr:hypothetical protein [Robiginitomaculum sp.]